MISPLPREFYGRKTLKVARELLGMLLIRRLGKGEFVGKVVEVEAYSGRDDPASHAYRGPTKRNSVMFGPPGVAYVYFAYGSHYCLNVVTERGGIPGAVLIRALEPLSGLEVMMKDRGICDVRELTSGPGRLTKALGITGEHNGLDLTKGSELFFAHGGAVEGIKVASSPRIGIGAGAERPWRFYVKDSPFVSRK